MLCAGLLTLHRSRPQVSTSFSKNENGTSAGIHQMKRGDLRPGVSAGSGNPRRTGRLTIATEQSSLDSNRGLERIATRDGCSATRTVIRPGSRCDLDLGAWCQWFWHGFKIGLPFAEIAFDGTGRRDTAESFEPAAGYADCLPKSPSSPCVMSLSRETFERSVRAASPGRSVQGPRCDD